MNFQLPTWVTPEEYARALEAMAGSAPDLLLINPNRRTQVNARASHIKGSRPRQPLGIAYTAATLRKGGVSVRLMDASILHWTVAQTADLVRRIRPRFVCVSTTQLDRWQNPDLDLTEVFALINAVAGGEGLPVIVEGTHGTVTPQWIFEKCRASSVIRGEPELTTLETMQALLSGKPLDGIAGLSWREDGVVRSNPDRRFDKPLDEYPFPAYDDLPMQLYRYTLEDDLPAPFTLMLTSRGCPISCTFCLKAMMPKGIRFRSPANVLEEMRLLKTLRIRSIYFQDWEFAANRPRAREVCQALAGADLGLRWGCSCRVGDLDDTLVDLMVKAGCVVVNVGFETGSQKMLDAVEKHVTIQQVETGLAACRKFGLKLRFFGLVNLPGETLETIEESTAFLARHGMDVVNPNIPIPYPGTKMYAAMGKEVPWDRVEDESGRVNTVLSPEQASAAFWTSLHRQRYGRLFRLNPFYLGKVVWPKVRRRLAAAI
jgi:radical SAM superfamily enzyme YgiQ (UPF0313 family)